MPPRGKLPVNGFGIAGRRLAPPYVAGYEAVAELRSGERLYVAEPPAPFGSLTELVPIPSEIGLRWPAEMDPALAVAVGLGLGGFGLADVGRLGAGDTVLVLGPAARWGSCAADRADSERRAVRRGGAR